MLSNSPFIGFIPVRDALVARAFYEGELGLRIVNDTPFALVVDANGTQLRLTPVPDLAPQSFTIAGWQVADISAMVRSLSDRGSAFSVSTLSSRTSSVSGPPRAAIVSRGLVTPTAIPCR